MRGRGGRRLVAGRERGFFEAAVGFGDVSGRAGAVSAAAGGSVFGLALLGVTRTEVRDLGRNKKAHEIDRTLGAFEDAGRLQRRTDADGRARLAELWIPKVA